MIAALALCDSEKKATTENDRLAPKRRQLSAAKCMAKAWEELQPLKKIRTRESRDPVNFIPCQLGHIGRLGECERRGSKTAQFTFWKLVSIDDFDTQLSTNPGDLFMDSHFAEENLELWPMLLRTQCGSTHEAIDTFARLTLDGTKEEFQQPDHKGEDQEDTAKQRMTMLLKRIREVSA